MVFLYYIFTRNNINNDVGDQEVGQFNAVCGFIFFLLLNFMCYLKQNVFNILWPFCTKKEEVCSIDRKTFNRSNVTCFYLFTILSNTQSLFQTQFIINRLTPIDRVDVQWNRHKSLNKDFDLDYFTQKGCLTFNKNNFEISCFLLWCT